MDGTEVAGWKANSWNGGQGKDRGEPRGKLDNSASFPSYALEWKAAGMNRFPTLFSTARTVSKMLEQQ